MKAIKLLLQDEKAKKNGFFLLVEGSRIDHAAHANDPVAHIYDMLELDKTVETIFSTVGLESSDQEKESNRRKWKSTIDLGETAVVVVADHETGGLSLGRDGLYEMRPQILAQIGESCQGIASSIVRSLSALNNTNWNLTECSSVVQQMFASRTHLNLTQTQLDILLPVALEAFEMHPNGHQADLLDMYGSNLTSVIGEIISEHALIGWTSRAHTGIDVNLYAAGPEQFVESLSGVVENTFVSWVVSKFLDLQFPSM